MDKHSVRCPYRGVTPPQKATVHVVTATYLYTVEIAIYFQHGWRVEEDTGFLPQTQTQKPEWWMQDLRDEILRTEFRDIE